MAVEGRGTVILKKQLTDFAKITCLVKNMKIPSSKKPNFKQISMIQIQKSKPMIRPPLRPTASIRAHRVYEAMRYH